jgi:hypothetical protein
MGVKSRPLKEHSRTLPLKYSPTFSLRSDTFARTLVQKETGFSCNLSFTAIWNSCQSPVTGSGVASSSQYALKLTRLLRNVNVSNSVHPLQK